jgi:hypothetical protein
VGTLTAHTSSEKSFATTSEPGSSQFANWVTTGFWLNISKGKIMLEKIADYALAAAIAGGLAWALIEGLCK